MWTFILLSMFVAVCSATTEVGDSSKTSANELLNFNVGDFQGLLFASQYSKHFENASMVPAGVSNKSMDVVMGNVTMLYRISRLASVPAQNVSLVSYQMTHMMVESSDNCHGFDFSLSLVSIIKLKGHIQVCTGSGGYWSLVSNPCISVFGFDLGCTEINLSSENVSYCWNVNVALAKAKICAVVKSSCLRFNGEGCYYSFPDWTCKDFDAEATCW